MASGARARLIPGELPVMAALVESGMHNLNTGDADALGFFQMRFGIWSGTYPGYPGDPALQLKWFIDQATKVRATRIAAGNAGYGLDPAKYGEWAADVEQPAAQYRGRYQLRLAEARGLVGLGCIGLPAGPTAPLPDVATFSDSPKRLRTSKTGRFTYSFVATPGRTGKARLSSTNKVRVGSKRRRLEVKPKSFTVPASATVKLRFKLNARNRRALRKRSSLQFKVKVTVGATSFSTKLRLRPPKTR